MNDVEMQMGIQSAYMQAFKSFKEGGVPVGSSLLIDGAIVSLGRNRRFQDGSTILHGEMDCIENAGHFVDLTQSTLFTTLSPCLMCSGAILLFNIPRLVVLDTKNTEDFETNLERLENKGVEVILVDHKPSIELNRRFQTGPETRKLWMGDVGK